jgi:hypothetical protein
MPWFNLLGSCKAQIAAADQDEATFILPEAEALQITQKAGEMAQGIATQMVAEKDAKEAPKGKPAKEPA